MKLGPTVALIGCGMWGRHILRDLVELGCVVPVVTHTEESRARAEDGGASVVVTVIGDLPKVDGVVAATPTSSHFAVVTEVLGLGVPVFVEKPLCQDADEADRAAKLGGERLFVMDKWRYHPGIEALRDIATSGELGPVVGLRCTRVGWGRVHDDVDSVLVLAPHDISIGLEVLGHIPEPRSAVAERNGNGLIAILGEAPWLVIEVSTSTVERRRETRLICEGGVAIVDNSWSDQLTIARMGSSPNEPQITKRAISNELPLFRELRCFVEHLAGGPPPRSSAQEGATNVRAIAKLRQIADRGVIVP
jgi:predicted dehydrogenase